MSAYALLIILVEMKSCTLSELSTRVFQLLGVGSTPVKTGRGETVFLVPLSCLPPWGLISSLAWEPRGPAPEASQGAAALFLCV